MDSERRRRAFLRLAGSAALAGLAGCIGGDGSGDSGDTAQTVTEGTTPMTTGDGTRTTTADAEATTGTGTPTARTETTPAATDDETTTTTSTETATETSGERATTTGAPDLSGPVPSAYRTATSQGGTDRNPDSLQPKDAVEYQSQPKDSERCSGCRFYLSDENGDGLGACSVVEGYIEPKAWCVSYSPYQDG